MSTPATVSIVENGKVRTIYNHWDGYPSNLGAMLFENYNHIPKIKSLINNGGASYIDKRVEPSKNSGHNFNDPEKEVCVFYHRVRGDDLEVYEHDTVVKMLNEIGQSHNYIFQDGKWYYCHEYNLFNCTLIPLDVAIKNDNDE